MSIEIGTPRRIVADGFAFAENPRWHDGRLVVADIHGGRVAAIDAAGTVETLVATPFSPSGIGFLPDGSLLVVDVHAMRLMRWNGRELSVHAELAGLARAGLNDMLVDPAGRAYAVQYGFDWRAGEAPRGAALLRVDADGHIEEAAADLHTGNGMALSSDGSLFVIAESAACRISAFDVDKQGRLANRRVRAQLPDGWYPDGICLDDRGGVWAACCYGPGVIRVEADGTVSHVVPVRRGRNAFACVFGGDDRATLFICTAEHEEPSRAKALMNSRIESLAVGYRGAGRP